MWVDSSVGVATGYEPDCQGSIPDRATILPLLQNVPTGSGPHPTFYSVGTGGATRPEL
jgi:hypothetical protein